MGAGVGIGMGIGPWYFGIDIGIGCLLLEFVKELVYAIWYLLIGIGFRSGCWHGCWCWY